MAKLSKEEMLTKINELALDDDSKIALMEDISDSVEVEDTTIVDELNAKVAELELKLEELKTRYKERFLSGEVVEEVKTEETEEPREEEIIDIKEI